MNILTFDIEDWFHILDNPSTRNENEWLHFPSRIEKNMDLIFETLRKSNQKATFFCLGWIAEKYPEIVKKIIKSGFEIGSHSYNHKLVYEQTPAEFKNDLLRSVAILEDLTGSKIRYYRAPGFSIRKDCLWALEILAEAGIEVDFSIFPAQRVQGGMPILNKNGPLIINYRGLFIKELPINYRKIAGIKVVFSGGGFFRFLPYNLIGLLAQESDYLMSYFHPRDFDPGQPRLKDLKRFKYFKSYVGLSKTKEKFDFWLEDYSFVDVTSAVDSINWNDIEIINF
jgi:polysaccharide deacetylase family protein (PEP-CTERM system associated)